MPKQARKMAIYVIAFICLTFAAFIMVKVNLAVNAAATGQQFYLLETTVTPTVTPTVTDNVAPSVTPTITPTTDNIVWDTDPNVTYVPTGTPTVTPTVTPTPHAVLVETGNTDNTPDGKKSCKGITDNDPDDDKKWQGQHQGDKDNKNDKDKDNKDKFHWGQHFQHVFDRYHEKNR